MPDGWQRWLDWQRVICPTTFDSSAVEADAGRYFGYLRLVARRRPGVAIDGRSRPCRPIHEAPLLRGE